MAVNQSLSLTQASQDAPNNSSKVRILWTSQQTGQSHNTNLRTAYYWISINGGTETQYSVDYKLPQYTTHTILDITIDVAHDDQGNASVSVRTEMDTRISAGVVTLQQSLTLTQIPRASTIGAGSADIETTLAISINRKSGTYTHSIQYRFGNLSGYIDGNGNPTPQEVKLSNTSCWFNIPADFYWQIPDEPRGQGTLYCRTYSGNSQIGETQTCNFWAIASRAYCYPLIPAAAVEDHNEKTYALTRDRSVMIKNHSTAYCVMKAEPRYGASVDSAQIGGAAVSLNSALYGERIIYGVTASSVKFYIKDSRGHDQEKIMPLTMIDYVDLTCNVVAKRTDPTSGNANITINGNYYDGSFGAVENTLTVKYRIGSGDYVEVVPTIENNTYSVVIPLTDMDYKTAYSVDVIATDGLMTRNPTATLEKGVPVFDWGENDFAFHVPVQFASKLAGLYVKQTYGTALSYLAIQTKFSSFDGNGNTRQTLLIFGSDNNLPLLGVAVVNNAGNCWWYGSEVGSVTVHSTIPGCLIVHLKDRFWSSDIITAMSADPFEFI